MSDSGEHRVLVTGGCGFIGQAVLAALAREGGCALIRSVDLVEPAPGRRVPKVLYSIADVRSAEMHHLIAADRIDVVVHLASIVSPGPKHTRALQYSVDVEGTRNVIEACVEQGVRQLVVMSSGAAYGYWRDNPDWLDEEDALRGNQSFAYSDHKRIVEEMLAEYRRTHPQLQQLILRPGTVLGAQVRNQITALFEKKVVLGVAGAATPFVMIWDEDVGAIVAKGVRERRSGIFNLAGDGVISLREIAAVLGKPYLPLPAALIQTALALLKPLGLSQYGSEQVDFLRYRPVLSNRRLHEEFGYSPRHSSAAVFRAYLEARRKKNESLL